MVTLYSVLIGLAVGIFVVCAMCVFLFNSGVGDYKAKRNVAIIVGVAVFLIWIFGAHRAASHEAETGWTYDGDCCSGTDCHHVTMKNVRATKSGWLVDVYPGEHPLAFSVITTIVPYDDPRVNVSKDQDFHVCIGGASQAVLCIYVPEVGA